MGAKCIHGLLFPLPELIQKDEQGFYRNWCCAKCGVTSRVRDLDPHPDNRVLFEAFRGV